jgi:acetoin utilization deacetylase AcuC-like enzyme
MRLLPRSDRSTTAFVYHPAYRLDLDLPEYDTERSLKILSYLEQRKLMRPGLLHRPRPASLRRLQLVHTRAYLERLQYPGALDTIVGHRFDPEAQDAFLRSQRAMVGGTIRATKLALAGGGVAVNLGGGLHHALADRGSGFCAFNDVAIAIVTYRQLGFTAPILTLDLDLHDGDGLRTLFADDPSVHTFSIHNRHLGPVDAVASTSIAVGTEIADDAYLDLLARELPAVVQRVRPGLVFYLAGGDLHVEDQRGDARLSLEGLVDRDRFVLDELRRLDPPPSCVILLAGGYGPHAWRHGAAFFSWLLTGEADYQPPLDLTLPLDQYRRLSRWLANPDPGDRRSDAVDDDDWGLTEDDLGWGRGLGARRFLTRFSLHGVELALEQAGLLQRLRERGHRRLRVEFELGDPLGDTLRVVCRDDQPLTLVELKLRIDGTADPPRRYLAIEWLLLQDARERFVLERRLLPGQHYPGLGLLRDVAAMLIVLAERLEVDGVTFVPAHYYIADRARFVARFLDPVEEARFVAVQRALRHLRLSEASDAVEAGRVRDARTGEPYVYRPAGFVIPVATELRSGATAQEHQRRVEEAVSRYAFELSGPTGPGDGE